MSDTNEIDITEANKVIALIDADSIAFKVAVVANNKANCSKFLKDRIRNIKLWLFADEVEIYIKGEGNFRKAINPEYKGQRQKNELDPKIAERLEYCYEYMRNHMGAIYRDGLEADDLVSMAAYYYGTQDGIEPVICAIDKDLKNCPFPNFNYDKEELISLTEDESDYHFWKQMLVGDTADNIKGIKGIGPKKADAILQNTKLGTRHRVIVDQYGKAFGTNWKQEFIKIGSCLWMIRYENETFEDYFNSLDEAQEKVTPC